MLLRRFGAKPLTGPIEAAVPGRGQVAGLLLAAEKLRENAHVELADLANVVGLTELVHQGVNVG